MKIADNPSAMSAAHPTGVSCEATKTTANPINAATRACGVIMLASFSRTAGAIEDRLYASRSRSVDDIAAIARSGPTDPSRTAGPVDARELLGPMVDAL